ncbi:HlyD family secretion protein [Acinetobacter pittii]|uniref:HlyD family secretion protein n=1 Tax=Acinetobacter pittii TaxID=48296 RepID=UPI00397DB5C2
MNYLEQKLLKKKKKRKSNLGNVLLFFPREYKIILISIFVFFFIIAFLLMFFSYNRTVAVKAELILNNGVKPIYIENPGIIKSQYFNEGEYVKAGESIFEITTNRNNFSSNNAISTIEKSLIEKKNALNGRKLVQNEMYQVMEGNILDKISIKMKDLNDLNALLRNLNNIKTEKKSMLERYLSNNLDNSVSLNEISIQKVEYLKIVNEIVELEQQKNRLNEDLVNLNYEKNNAKLDLRKNIFLIEENLKTVEQELTLNEQNNGYILKSPVDGYINVVQDLKGIYLNTGKNIANIIPSNSLVEAMLFIPSSSIGFVKVGGKVNLRYDAYPYQQFGQGEGVIYSISPISVSSENILNAENDNSGSYFIAKVKIKDQKIKYNNNVFYLKPGMKAEVDIILENKRVYEWILKPLMYLKNNVRSI